jgi:leucyl-tRNA synthetase
VSHFMIATNELRRLGTNKEAVLTDLVVMIAPFAPHLAEELWQRLGKEGSVCNATWPTWDEVHLKSDTVNYPIQINGKLRGTVELAADATAADAEAAALALDQIQKWMEGKPPKKVVFILGKMINIVV